jgi:hypothetical protein
VVRGSTLSVRGEPLTVIHTSVRPSLCACAGYVVVIFPGYLPFDAPVVTTNRVIEVFYGISTRTNFPGRPFPD